MNSSDRILTLTYVARCLRISTRQAAKWQARGILPDPVTARALAQWFRDRGMSVPAELLKRDVPGREEQSDAG